MKHQAPTSPSRPHQQPRRAHHATGFTLVELMVSLAIGLVVIGAVFANYLNNSAGVRQAAAMAQVTQDAALAMGILRNHIAMAGYSRPLSVNSTTGAVSHYFSGADAGSWTSLYGCTNGFDNATDSAGVYAAIGCNAAGPLPDALAVSYEADKFSTPTSGAAAIPTDCTGTALTPYGVAPNTYYVADSRFAIIPAAAGMPPSLGCMGNGSVALVGGALVGGRQALVENIADMRILYGIGAPAAPAGGPLGTSVTQYVTAAVLNGGTVAGGWTRVLSVRICLLAQSSAQVLNPPDAVAGQPYLDCDGGITYATDRRIHQRFETTIVLNNRT